MAQRQTRTDTTCPVCLNKEWQNSADGGETWTCSLCMATFEEE